MGHGTNAPARPEFEGQIVKFRSPHNDSVILYDIAVRNEKHGWLEWHAINSPTEEQKRDAFWAFSAATDRALARVASEGISYHRAALEEGIALSTIYRAKKRRDAKAKAPGAEIMPDHPTIYTLLAQLTALDFDSDDPIEGAEVVDVINEHWPLLRQLPALIDALAEPLSYARSRVEEMQAHPDEYAARAAERIARAERALAIACRGTLAPNALEEK